MSSASSSSRSAPSASSSRSIADADPVTRNALRYTVSAREYELLHKYLLSRAPLLHKRSPHPERRDVSAHIPEDYNASTVRLTVRLFLASYTGLKAWELISTKLLGRAVDPKKTRLTFFRSANFRLSLSLSSILLFHRVLFRFLVRLRESLRTEDAKPFRRRNPRVWRALTSRLAPAVGASFAGLFLAVSRAEQIRITIAIFAFAKSLEFSYNNLENRGYFKSRPWWFGSWLLMPPALGQLLHAFVFDRECFPASYGNFIMKRSPEYIQQRPDGYPANLKWPAMYEVVGSLGTISELKWPAFVSPIMFPKIRTLPVTLNKIAPITDPAHPAIKRLSCAVLHPHDPSCLRTFVSYYIRAFPMMAKFFTAFYALFALPRYRAFISTPMAALNKFAARVLRTSIFTTSAIGTAWSSICLLQRILPRHVLPTSRWFVSGFLAGLWAFIERRDGRGTFMDTARMSLDSLWKVGKKRGWWKGIKNGDVLLFAVSLALINCIYEKDPKAVTGGVVRKGLGVVRGDGWVDRAAKKEGEGAEEKKKE